MTSTDEILQACETLILYVDRERWRASRVEDDDTQASRARWLTDLIHGLLDLELELKEQEEDV